MNAQPELPTLECDLVMKGGITSGVVYPGAITRISDKYRFRNLGGASAGAIAAVAAAACEYRRNQGDRRAFEILDEVGTEISKQGFVQSLFQPTEAARPAFDVALRLATSSGSFWPRLTKAVVSILRVRGRFLLGAATGVVLWGALLGLAVWMLASGSPSTWEAVAAFLLGLAALLGAALIVAGVAAVALVRFASQLNRALNETWFGMCTGRTEPGQPPDSGLTDWLYKTVQRCAGDLPANQPLTFKMLHGRDAENPEVNLQLITTDLSASRPVLLPIPEPDPKEPEPPYLFDEDEWRQLFPKEVVDHMVRESKEAGPPVQDEKRTLYPVPRLQLPIVVAARLSLSFPILLATVPFWRADGPGGEVVQHTMSDGGISSNFPIHFFDSLFPGRPTFGLDLQPWRVPTDKLVEMSDARRQAQFSKVEDVGNFFGQILNAARNWRDNMQAELPGYRDRICQIRLSSVEGGLNLNMQRDVVQRLVERGEEAGAIVADGESFDWNRHRITRFWTMMQMLQQSLGPLGFGRPGVYAGEHPSRKAFKSVVEEWQAAGASPEPPPFVWWTSAMQASDAVFALAEEWSDFEEGAPTPKPTLRILPRV